VLLFPGFKLLVSASHATSVVEQEEEVDEDSAQHNTQRTYPEFFHQRLVFEDVQGKVDLGPNISHEEVSLIACSSYLHWCDEHENGAGHQRLLLSKLMGAVDDQREEQDYQGHREGHIEALQGVSSFDAEVTVVVLLIVSWALLHT